MKVSVETRDPAHTKSDLLAIPLARVEPKRPRLPARAAAIDRALGGAIGRVIRSGDFRGKSGETLWLYPGEAPLGATRILLAGLGEEAQLSSAGLRRMAGAVVGEARGRRAERVCLLVPTSRRVRSGAAAQALAEGAALAAYRSSGYQTRSEDAPGEVASLALAIERAGDARAARAAVTLGVTLAECQNVARHLSNEPANALPPATLAREAQRAAKEARLACRVLGVPELKRLKMGAMLAVGQGSANPPRLVVLEHNRPPRGRRRRRPTIAVIGKGITFDSGGISIKPGQGMQDMKHDMSGAAAVVGILRAVAELRLPLHVVGVLAAAENMPSGSAYRPGDILTSMSGKTIEIQNTDAEGRLVLADALHYARTEFEPDAMIDLATLTGACVIALGRWSSGLFGTHDRLVELLRKAGETTGERVWPMPLWDEHRKHMRSAIADLKNVGGREAGATTAAAFLAEFVGDTPWAHLDIAGTAWTDRAEPGQPYGATGVGVRLVVEALRNWRSS